MEEKEKAMKIAVLKKLDECVEILRDGIELLDTGEDSWKLRRDYTSYRMAHGTIIKAIKQIDDTRYLKKYKWHNTDFTGF